MKFYYYIKNLTLNLIDHEFLINSNISLSLKQMTEKFIVFFNTHFPQLSNFLTDVRFVYNKNKNFILYSLRNYFYLTIFFYCLTLFTTTFGLLLNNKYLLLISNLFWNIYMLWTLPIKNVRFVIGRIVWFPFNVFSFIFDFFKNTLDRFKFVKQNKAECSSREDKKYRKELKSNYNPIDDYTNNYPKNSTMYSLNCMNFWRKSTFDTLFGVNNALGYARYVSRAMDSSEPVGSFKEAVTKPYQEKINKNWNMYPCPWIHDYLLHQKNSR